MPVSLSSLWLRGMPALFVLLWSTGFIGAKYGLPHADPLAFLSVRYVWVIILMTLLAFWARAPWPQGYRSWIHLGVAGLLIHAAYLGGVFTAIDRGLPAGIASLVVGMQPLLTAVLAGWMLQERVTRRQWLGVALGLLGLIMVVGGREQALLGEGGVAFERWIPAVIALFAITLGTLYQKRFCPSFDLRTGLVVQFIPVLILTALCVPLFGSWQIEWTGDFIFALGWLVLVLSLGAVSLLSLLIRAGGAVSVSSLFYLTPAVTAIVAWLLFDERLNALQLCGMVVAITGVWLSRSRVGVPPATLAPSRAQY